MADRWHLMENASAAFLGMVKQSMRSIRKAFGTGRVDPAQLTSAELRQYDGWVRREEENAAILALAKAGVSIKEIAWRMSRSRSSSGRLFAVDELMYFAAGQIRSVLL